jgi:hypothetical protein
LIRVGIIFLGENAAPAGSNPESQQSVALTSPNPVATAISDMVIRESLREVRTPPHSKPLARRGGEVVGVVRGTVQLAGNRPVRGGRVVLHTISPRGANAQFVGQIRRSGEFCFQLSDGNILDRAVIEPIPAMEPGFVRTVQDLEPTVLRSGIECSVILKVDEGCVITGRVVDLQTDLAVQDVRVSIVSGLSDPTNVTTQTDGAGRFRLAGIEPALVPRQVTLGLRHPDYLHHRQDWAIAPSLTELQVGCLEITKAALMRGSIERTDGGPLAGFTVECQPEFLETGQVTPFDSFRRTTTDESGRFTLGLSPAATSTELVVRHLTQVVRRLKVEEGWINPVRIRIPTQCRVAVCAVQANGEVLPGEDWRLLVEGEGEPVVQASWQADEQRWAFWANESGLYRLHGVAARQEPSGSLVFYEGGTFLRPAGSQLEARLLLTNSSLQGRAAATMVSPLTLSPMGSHYIFHLEGTAFDSGPEMLTLSNLTQGWSTTLGSFSGRELSVTLSPGRHRLRFHRPGFEPVCMEVLGSFGRTQFLALDL